MSEKLTEDSPLYIAWKAAFEVMRWNYYKLDSHGYHPYQGDVAWLKNEDNFPHVINDDGHRLLLFRRPHTHGVLWDPMVRDSQAIELINHSFESPTPGQWW